MCTISIVWKPRNGLNVKRSLGFFSIQYLSYNCKKRTGAKKWSDSVLCDFGVAYAKGVDYNKTIFISDTEAERACDRLRRLVKI